jgi:anthranilate synthase component 1
MVAAMSISRELPAPALSAVDLCRLVGGSTLLETERWSLIGIDPVITRQVRGGDLSWTEGPIGGAVCVLGCDAFRSRPAGRLAGEPDAVAVFPSTVIRREAGVLRLVASGPAASRLDQLQARLAAAPATGGPAPAPAPVPEPHFDSDIDDDAYRKMIEAAHRRVVAGEAEQVTISRRFTAPAVADPVAVYRVLRETNASPYHFLLRLPEQTLVGASPQGLIRVRGREVTVPVIAGTRRRGRDAAADATLADELLADPKERAEHAMLVELARSDLAGVAEPGSLTVTGPRVARYGRVMHLVSQLTGELAPGRSGFDALAAVFPAGTVAGTPRAAALRIIDEIEPRPRGLYGGGVGWFDADGELEFCLGIRTLAFRDGTASCQAGAGVVAGSVPDREVRESRDKASALFAALEAAVAP